MKTTLNWEEYGIPRSGEVTGKAEVVIDDSNREDVIMFRYTV